MTLKALLRFVTFCFDIKQHIVISVNYLFSTKVPSSNNTVKIEKI